MVARGGDGGSGEWWRCRINWLNTKHVVVGVIVASSIGRGVVLVLNKSVDMVLCSVFRTRYFEHECYTKQRFLCLAVTHHLQ